MKKCPFCAEDIQDQATVCKHCKRSLVPTPQPQVSTNVPASINALTAHHSVDWKKVLKIFGILVLVILSFQFWYITIPGAAIWYLWKKAKFSKKTNIIATAALVVVFAILEGTVAYAGRAPTLTISDPQNNYSVQAQTVSINGKVNPAKISILVNGNRVATDDSGNFSYQAQLSSEGSNQVTIVASNGDKQTTTTLTVNRIFTDAEKTAKAQADADAAAKAKADADAAAAAQAAADAKAKADDAAYSKTPAGKLCAKHPDWLKDECQNVADNKIWIGMMYDMVTAERGLPNHVNTSNYGNGNEYQACWYDITPSCFYFKSDDIITSYN
jgi:nucleoid-associated protein YgaU